MEEKEFRQYFDNYYNMLCNYASRFSDQPEDVVQEVFSSLWTRNTELSAIQNMKTYLLGAVHFKCASDFKKKKHNVVPLFGNEEQENVVQELSEDILESEFQKNMLKELLFNSIRQLPPACNRIFVLAKIDGKSYKDISAELNISTKTIENQINKAYKTLRKLLKDKI